MTPAMTDRSAETGTRLTRARTNGYGICRHNPSCVTSRRRGHGMSAAFVIAVQPVAVPKPTAAAMLGMSVDSFERYVMADVRCVRRGRLRLYPVAELQQWAADNAQRTLEGLA